MIEKKNHDLCFVAERVESVYWKSTNSIREIVKKRASQAGLEYFHPHSFRHTAIYLAMKRCRNAEEIKAVSQNFGHENVGTTLMTYGKLDDLIANSVKFIFVISTP
jgi:integrase